MALSRLSSAALAAFAGVVLSSAAVAQAPDSVFARAKQLVVNGNGAAGRLLVDSVVAATTPGTPAYAEALYWRAALAASSADAERDYRHIVVEYPETPRSAEALLALAQLEIARGDRATASAHLQRFLAENPSNTERSRVSLQLVRLWFDQNDLAHGCATLKTALAEVPEAEVEAHNQLTYYSSRCVAADVGPGGSMPAPPAAQPPQAPPPPKSASASAKSADSVRRDSSTSSASTASATSASGAKAQGNYTLQVAAFKAKSDADALVKRLKARKLDVRVIGTSKLYRVRVGRYSTRAAAVSAQKELKAKKIDAIVTVIGAEEK